MSLWSTITNSWQEAWNEIEYPKLSRGSVLRIELNRLGILGFDHYGIYAGNKEVIHFSKGKIRKESIKKFIEGAGIFNGNFVEVMAFSEFAVKNITLEESYMRAKSCIGLEGYNVLDSNCEHFALWCRTGVAISGQAFGSVSDTFEVPSASASLINIPRKIGELFNELGMEKSRSISIENIIDL